MILLCKIQGTDPKILRFFCFFLFFNSFLPSEDKNPTSAISCSSFYVKLFPFYFSIKKSDTVIGGGLIFIRSPTRMGPPTRRSRASLYMTSLFPHFAVPFENSTRKLFSAHVSGQERNWRHAIKTNLSVRSAKQIKDRSVQIIWFSAAELDIPCSAARRHGSTAAVSLR